MRLALVIIQQSPLGHFEFLPAGHDGDAGQESARLSGGLACLPWADFAAFISNGGTLGPLVFAHGGPFPFGISVVALRSFELTSRHGPPKSGW
jgi:hypothetical protein